MLIIIVTQREVQVYFLIINKFNPPEHLFPELNVPSKQFCLYFSFRSYLFRTKGSIRSRPSQRRKIRVFCESVRLAAQNNNRWCFCAVELNSGQFALIVRSISFLNCRFLLLAWLTYSARSRYHYKGKYVIYLNIRVYICAWALG